MSSKVKLTIIDPVGIHVRPASVIAKEASNHKGSDFELTYKGKKANLKSIMSVMSLGIPKGAEIELSVSGGDAKAALDEVVSSMKKQGLVK